MDAGSRLYCCTGRDGRVYEITASSLKELEEKLLSVAELNTPSGSIVFQLIDGTVVDDDDYLRCLGAEEAIFFKELRPENLGTDVVDSLIKPFSDDLSESEKIRRITFRLNQSFSSLTLLTREELELVANADPVLLLDYLHLSEEEIEKLQEACHESLLKRDDAGDLLSQLQVIRSRNLP